MAQVTQLSVMATPSGTRSFTAKEVAFEWCDQEKETASWVGKENTTDSWSAKRPETGS